MSATRLKRPVYLFSKDSERFWAVPSTTGGLKAYYLEYGHHADTTDIQLLHFKDQAHIDAWREAWPGFKRELQLAVDSGMRPVVGFSMYTWNAAEFLELIHLIKNEVPQVLCIAGGPHVQQAEDYLHDDPIDAIVLGEGESSFQEFLDAATREQWRDIAGLAFVDNGEIVTTTERARRKELDALPSALDVVPLIDDNGAPIYDSLAYESSRGCPFKCALCEWGTGAIGTKMYQFSMERIERDWRKAIAAGIKDIWLADSNFGALREDLDKARLICELKTSHGLPSSFATSWSKKHSPRVQEIVLLLHRNGLLPHYQLALQTLTPLALELSNRKNMAANKYEPIARDMAQQGVPIAAELIWGLPGDNLADFERNLDELLQVFPALNIFAYTLLPGTEFYEKRHEYRIETIPVAGYGKAKGEYVVACHTFDRNEGLQGYLLITAHILFSHGHILPYSTRYLAQQSGLTTATLMRGLLRFICERRRETLADIALDDPLTIYEARSEIYLQILADRGGLYGDILAFFRQECGGQLSTENLRELECIIHLDELLSPQWGDASVCHRVVDFDLLAVKHRLDAMERPEAASFQLQRQEVSSRSPGGVGTILQDPDGGAWLRAEIVEGNTDSAAEAPQAVRIMQPGSEALARAL